MIARRHTSPAGSVPSGERAGFRGMSDTDDNIILGTVTPAAAVAALYNASKPLNMGFLHATDDDMTTDEAELVVGSHLSEQGLCIDYLQGRVMKIQIQGGSFDPRLYDRDNGQGAAARQCDAPHHPSAGVSMSLVRGEEG